MSLGLRSQEIGFGTSSGRGAIGESHRCRQAIVYVRQSTNHQLKNNPESRRLQYALAEKVKELGWKAEQIEIIDEDLGKSGGSGANREGFQRLQHEIYAGNVGLVMVLEVSRLSRANLDWQYLVWLCRLSQTLLGDQDMIYDPTQPNDSLILGVKGAMSEFELHTLHQRMEQGKWCKAERGELRLTPPRGYVLGLDGKLEKDPDESVRRVIELVFRQFERQGSVRAVVRYLEQERIKLPYRSRKQSNRGQILWGRPRQGAVLALLKNPLYSGAYVYGRSRMRPSKSAPGPGGPCWREFLPRSGWRVMLPDRHPAYISLEQFERNQERLLQNRPSGLGAARQGPSLLAGLVRCGHCGHRMQVSYRNNGRGLSYRCIQEQLHRGKRQCQSLVGKPLEEAVEQLVLEALGPASVQLNLRVLQEVEQERAEREQLTADKLARARYQVQFRQRRYEACDPEFRLVARTLEQEWEQSLKELEQLEREAAQMEYHKLETLSEEQQQRLLALCSNIPSLWRSAATTAEQRQSLVRLLIDRVEVSIVDGSEKVLVRVHFSGGECAKLQLRRPVSRLSSLSFYPQMLEEITQLYEQELEDQKIAQQLNQWGRHSARGNPLSASTIGTLRRNLGLRRSRRKNRILCPAKKD